MTQDEIVKNIVTQINTGFQKRPLLINISGCTGAGKSTWAKFIFDEFKNHNSAVVHISEDEFLQPRSVRTELKNKVYESGEWQGKTYFENHDNWIRLDEMKNVIQSLGEGESVSYNPYYRETGDLDIHEKTVEPTDIFIFETSIFNEFFDVVILIDVDDEDLLKRKLERDRDLRDEKTIREYHRIQLAFWNKHKPINPTFTIDNNDFAKPKLSRATSFKLIISDFDYTLSLDNSVTEVVKSSIEELHKSGYLFSIATGKSFQGIIEKVCEELEIKCPVIVRGGSEIFDPTTKKTVWAEYLSPEDAKKIIQLLIDEGIPFEVNREECVYSPNEELYLQETYKKYSPFESLTLDKIAKIRLVTNEKNEIKTKEFIEETLLSKFNSIHVVEIPRGHDITSEKATKHLAVLELSKLLDISPSEMIGIGDGYNDYPLLTAVGYKVAMFNAPKELIEIADLIVPTVQENGVALLIKKLLSNEIK